MRLGLLLGQSDGFRFDLPVPGPLCFAVLGDPHRGKLHADPEWAPSPVLARIVGEVNLLTPSFVITIGDLIQGYTADEAMLTRQHQGFLDEVNRLEAPFLPCIGNHDVREEVSERVWRSFWGPRYYSFDAGGCHFVVLDAELNKDLESIAGPQLDWLRGDLELAGDKKIFVFGHRPYWKDYPLHKADWKGPGGRNYWTEDVESLFQDRDVAAVIVGHQHRFESALIGGVLHLTTGGAGGDVFDYSLVQGGIPHYLLVKVGPHGCRFLVIVPGSIASELEIREKSGDVSELWGARGPAAVGERNLGAPKRT